jgi:hypothetical protein
MALLDNKKLAVIHIVKKELGLTDKEYRDILEKNTGVRSAKDMDEQAFRRLMNYFARSKYYRANAQGITLRQKLYIKHLTDDLGWDQNHFLNFLKKYYKTGSIKTLSKKDASKIIESLKHILTHRDRHGACVS